MHSPVAVVERVTLGLFVPLGVELPLPVQLGEPVADLLGVADSDAVWLGVSVSSGDCVAVEVAD